MRCWPSPLRRWEFLTGEIWRTGADADGEHGGDGGGAVSGAAVRKAFAAASGRGGAGGGVFHSVEAGAGGGAGDAVFVLYDAAAGDFVYGGTVRGGHVCARDARIAERDAGSADWRRCCAEFPMLPNFANFDVMGAAAHGRAIPGALVGAEHALRGAVLRDGAGSGGGDFLAAQSEMNVDEPMRLYCWCCCWDSPACGSCRSASMRSKRRWRLRTTKY